MKRLVTICLVASLFLVFSVCAEGQTDPGKGIGPDGTPPGQIGKENPGQGIGQDGTPPGQGGENPGKGEKGSPPGLNKEGANAEAGAEAFASAVVEGGTNNVTTTFENVREYPVPVAPYDIEFVIPYSGEFEPGVKSPFGLGKKFWSTKEMEKYASPPGFLLVLPFPDWSAAFEVETAMWERGKRDGGTWVLECLGGDLSKVNDILKDYERIGNPHGNVKDLKKDAYQLALATAFKVEQKNGVDLLLFMTAETVVTSGNMGQIGAGNTNAGVHNSLAGIFGVAKASTEPKGKGHVWCAAYKLKEGCEEPFALLSNYSPKLPQP